jgi:hypothetical protein
VTPQLSGGRLRSPGMDASHIDVGHENAGSPDIDVGR